MNKKVIILFTLSLLFPDKSSADIQVDINKKNNEIESLKLEIQKVETLIENKSKEEKINNDLIKQIDNKIKLTEKLIKTLTNEENYLTKQIYLAEENISIKEKELFVLKNQLKNRVRYLYKYGKENLVTEMMQTNDWDKLIYRKKYLQILNEYEEKIKSRIKDNINDLLEEKKSLQKEKKNKEKLIKSKNKEFSNLEDDRSRKKLYIKKIRNQKNELQKNLNSKKEMINQIKDLVKKLYADKDKTKKREEELARIRTQKNKATSGNFAKMKGKLNWPVKGKIVGQFGNVKNQKLNTITENIGIDILTSSNEKVYSVLDGVILTITNIRNFGDIVILDHGAGYYSVYSNLKNINVFEGQYIDTNTIIGSVELGSNFNYPDQHVFNFQIWSNEKKLNPELWLKK
tara:strand:- start:3845 stop:5050 length:1206 start_codon:yes stop_codon:yes gene_type:complete